ncbi:LysE family translocator [Leptolyngbya sp. PCC 6406]|uniref:LysE family translocator n=1 Tax=Leptolyngbya sp. PCC 6406 TaxID=1173264 RepID=UPI0002AD16C5|nr:LysE family translocator [Leptolyngbya sp. PCC 6406]
MQSTITLGSTLALFSAMAVLAAIPSVSVLMVTTRSATLGLSHGVCTALGIVAGDLVFIGIALGGLSLVAHSLGDLAIPIQFLIRYGGGFYLIVLGVGLIRSGANPIGLKTHQKSSSQRSGDLRSGSRGSDPQLSNALGSGDRGSGTQDSNAQDSALLSSFLAGLSITLADQKATLFYLGFLPTFVDGDTVSRLDGAIIMTTAIGAVGGVKLIYAVMAHRVSGWINLKLRRRMTAIVGTGLILIGLWRCLF